MKITVLTLFPEIINQVMSSSITGRAQKNNFLKLNLVNIRDFATDRHKTVDDKPYGGGVGMVMRLDVLDRAIEAVKTPPRSKFREKIILLDPKGKLYNQTIARNYSKLDHLILICGHYEGIDSRIYNFVDEVVSVGEYILTGGEIP